MFLLPGLLFLKNTKKIYFAPAEKYAVTTLYINIFGLVVYSEKKLFN